MISRGGIFWADPVGARLMHEVDRGLRKVLELSWAPVDKSAYVTRRRRMNRNPTNTTDAQTGLCTV